MNYIFVIRIALWIDPVLNFVIGKVNLIISLFSLLKVDLIGSELPSFYLRDLLIFRFASFFLCIFFVALRSFATYEL